MIESGEVKLHFLDYWRVIRMRAGLIVLVFLLVMVTAGVTTYFLPRRYLAKVTMEVRRDDASNKISTGPSRITYDPQFVATQFQILRKTEILYPVVRTMELIKVYSGDGQRLTLQQAAMILEGSLDLQETRGTDLIEVGVWNTDRELAAQIANTISNEYRNRRLADLQAQSDRNLSQYQDAVTTQRKTMQADFIAAAQIGSKLGIVDPDVENASAVLRSGNQDYLNIDRAVNEEQLKVEQLHALLEAIQNLKAEALQEVLRQFNIEDQGVTANLNQLQQARVEESNLLNSGLGENHPRIRALRAKAVTHSQILNELLDGIRRGQAAKLKLEEDTLVRLKDRLAEEGTKAVASSNDSGAYVEAKSKYIQSRNLYQASQTALATARMDFAIVTDPVRIWQRAETPLHFSSPPVKQYLLGSIVIGLIVGVLLAFFIEYLDTSVKTIDDVERFLETTVLAVIPKGIPMLIRIGGDHVDAEAYRILRVKMEFEKPKPDARTITMISAGPGEGKSTTLNNLAYTCARGGYNVLVVDADLRRPTQHTFFETDNNFGLTDFLLGKATVDAIIRPTKIDNLSFIPSGHLPPDEVGILNSQAMTQVIARLRSQYDLVLFDSPPILGVSDGSVLASEVDMTIMVIQHRRFPRSMLQRVHQAVKQVGGHFVGVVLNNVDTRNDDGSGYYNSYQQYYSAPRSEHGGARPSIGPATAPRRLPGGHNHGNGNGNGHGHGASTHPNGTNGNGNQEEY